MHPTLAPVVDLYQINTTLVPQALDGVKKADLATRPLDKANSIHWIVGHLATSRIGLGGMIGLDVEVPWTELFARGTEAGDSSAYPAIDEITDVWDHVSNGLLSRFGELSEDELLAPSPVKFPVSEETIRGVISFLSLHESYHVGQLAYLRRLLGYDQLVG